MIYQGTFPTLERMCEVFARVLEAKEEGVSITITPKRKEARSEKIIKSH